MEHHDSKQHMTAILSIVNVVSEVPKLMPIIHTYIPTFETDICTKSPTLQRMLLLLLLKQTTYHRTLVIYLMCTRYF